jgi:predicted phage terminase large subunit-like protein
MGNLSLKRIDEVKVGDKVVGFDIGDKDRRARLKPAEVLSISKSVRPVVKMLLDSGHTIRCTPDHKWFTGRHDFSHKPYAPAHLGSKLRRVCPPELERLETEEEFRLAGWVSGFFDGEGSVSVLKRRHGEGSSLITFFQSAEQNLPLCEKLEYSLARFGFNFGCHEKIPTTLSAAGTPWQKRRSYYLKSDAGSGVTKNGNPAKRASKLQLNQKFLHLIKPTKWRQRLIDTTVNGRMYTTSERVVSIKPDGQDIVYGLETTTGNYVVWGLASSNSGQYLQSPEPRGGAIIKRDFWQLWEQEKFPTFEYILAALDTAYTEKKENDSSALVIFGVFRDDSVIPDIATEALWMSRMTRGGQVAKPVGGNPKIMMMYAWQERLEFYDLIEKIINTCVISPAPASHPRFPIDRLLIEGKASGLSVAQELHRALGATGKFGIETIDPRLWGDKISRVHSIQHIFADKMVYAPDRKWADEVINQVSVFPRGARDDLVDCVSMGIRYLRDTGFALRREESELARREELTYSSRPRPLYEV